MKTKPFYNPLARRICSVLFHGFTLFPMPFLAAGCLLILALMPFIFGLVV
jgi:hypothetical protein